VVKFSVVPAAYVVAATSATEVVVVDEHLTTKSTASQFFSEK